jgi:predicted transcriptional regulator
MNPTFRLTNAETKLAELLWNRAPLGSMELVRLAQEAFGWKKSTTFTNLKSLIDKGLARNEDAQVRTLCSRDEWLARQSRRYVDEAYGGSLPLFVASFTSGRRLSPEQAAELRRLIDAHEEGGCRG